MGNLKAGCIVLTKNLGENQEYQCCLPVAAGIGWEGKRLGLCAQHHSLATKIRDKYLENNIQLPGPFRLWGEVKI